MADELKQQTAIGRLPVIAPLIRWTWTWAKQANSQSWFGIIVQFYAIGHLFATLSDTNSSTGLSLVDDFFVNTFGIQTGVLPFFVTCFIVWCGDILVDQRRKLEAKLLAFFPILVYFVWLLVLTVFGYFDATITLMLPLLLAVPLIGTITLAASAERLEQRRDIEILRVKVQTLEKAIQRSTTSDDKRRAAEQSIKEDMGA